VRQNESNGELLSPNPQLKIALKELTREAKIGRKIVAVAVFEVTSVNVVIITQTIITIA